ncbi:MAG: GILT family protein, partial [Nanoarchaeota archaeon]|nr:GILT family protein [Nanoarchaeota archaeon]
METENVESKKPEVKHEVKHEAKHDAHHEAHKKSVSNDAKQGKNKIPFWPALSAVLAALLLISLFSGQTVSSNAPGASKSLDAQQFSLNMKNFIQESLTQNAAEVAIENLTEENGLYKFSVMIDGKLAALSYATKDGALLFPQVLDVAKVAEQAKQIKESGATEAPPVQAAIKSDKPIVQLFVMSQCPYGVQAENAIKPVLDTLKDKISFELRFIANQKADGTFSSLHGQAEVDENVRQLCAAKY